MMSFLQLSAQYNGISISGGPGSYDLTDLKTYQNDLIDKFPVALRQFDNFPIYTNIKINIFKTLETGLSYGITYAYSTTGSHANYTDFSGYINLDQAISAYQAGLTASYSFLDFFVSSEKHLEFSVYGELRLAYIRNNVGAIINTSYYFENNSIKLSTITPFSEFGLQGMYHMQKISLGVEGGYLIDFGAKMNAGDQSSLNSSFSIQPDGDIKSQMSGIRLGLKLILWINPQFPLE